MRESHGDLVEVPVEIIDAMVAHSQFTYPEEACGLVAADESGLLRMVYCLTNSERSQVIYTVDPTEHFRALQHAESQGWALVGAFHSHPQSPPFPSATDLRLAVDPDWLHFIVGLQADPLVRGFYLRDGVISEVALRVIR